MASHIKNTAHLKMGLKILSGNAHSSEAAILPSAPWRLVWALGTMQNEKGELLVEGLHSDLRFAEMKIGYTGSGDMTILPAEAYCNLDIELTEGQSAGDVCKILRAHLDGRGFEDVGVWAL